MEVPGRTEREDGGYSFVFLGMVMYYWWGIECERESERRQLARSGAIKVLYLSRLKERGEYFVSVRDCSRDCDGTLLSRFRFSFSTDTKLALFTLLTSRANLHL